MSDENNQNPQDEATINNLLKERKGTLKEISKLQVDLAKAQADYEASIEQGNLDLNARAAVIKAQIAEQRKIQQFAEESLEIAKARGETDQALIEGLNAQAAAAKEAAESFEKIQGQMGDMVPQAERIASFMGFDRKWEQTLWGSMAKGGMEELGTRTAMLGGSILSMMSPANLLGGALMKIQESTMMAIWSFDNASSSLAAATGQGNRYNDMIMDVSDTNRRFGVSIEGAAQAIQGLSESMSGFSDASAEVQTALVAQTARMERLGVSAQTTGKINDQLMKGMGMTAQQAMATNDELARTAMGIGIPVGKMAQEFEAAMPALAQYGKDAPKIFKKVMAAAKGLGVEMNTLLGFTSQFDTFEGAASAVGKLNNILGGDLLNSYEMINASEEERIKLLLQGVESSGKSWNSMNRFEKMAVANAAGINDMAEANKMFSGGLAGYEEAQRKAEENAVSQAELEKRTQASVSVQEKMMMVMQQLAVAVQPIVNALHSFFNAILAINDATGGALVPIFLGFIGLLALLSVKMNFAQKAADLLAFAQGKKSAAMTQGQIAAMNAATAEKQLALTQTQAALACDKETLCKELSTKSTLQNTAAKGSNTGATNANAAAEAQNAVQTQAATTQESLNTSQTTANTTAKGMNSTATNANAMSEAQNAAATAGATTQEGLNTAATTGNTTAKGINTGATGMNTTATTANTTAKNMGILASLRMAAASAFATAKTIALTIAEKAAAIGRYALGTASGFLAKMFTVQSAAQAKVATTAPAAAGGLAGLAAAMAALGVPPAILALAAIGAIALGLGGVAIAAAIVVFSLVSLVKAFMQMPDAILPAVFGLGMFMATLLVFVGMVALMAPIIPLFIISAIGIGQGMMLMAPGLIVGSIGLMIFGAALKLFDAKSFLAMIGLTLAIVPFAIAMAIAAPLLAASVIAVPALIGLGIGFAALGIGLAIATLGIPAMVALAMALPSFATSLFVSAPLLMLAAGMMVPAAISLGIAFAVLGIGLLIGTLGIPGMILLSIFLPSFAMSLLASAIPMGMAAAAIAPAAIALGIGFAILGIGLAIATLGIPGMILLSIFLPMFAGALLTAAIPFGMAAIAIAPAALLLGVGLAVLGAALQLFGLETVLIMALLGPALAILAAGLIFSAPLMLLAGLLFAPAAILVGTGLLLIGMALQLFNDKTIPVMALLGPTLALFALSLFFASPLMLLAAATFAPAALLVGLGLLAIGMGLKLFDRKAAKTMTRLGPALIAFSLGLFFAAPFMFLAGGLFTLGALSVAGGLLILGLALKVFGKKSYQIMEGLAVVLPVFAMALAIAGLPMLYGGILFGIGALAAAPGLMVLGLAMKVWKPGSGKMMHEIGEALPVFAQGIADSGMTLLLGAFPFAIASFILAPALYFLAGPLFRFGEAIALIAPFAAQLPAIGEGLAKMGPGLVIFAFSMLAVGLAASLPFFSTGIGVFQNALSMLATSFESVPTEKAVALGQFFEGLAALSDLNNIADVMWEIAWGVIGVSSALALMPEEKAFAMSTLMTSVSDASVKVTPEAVENVTGLVEQAAVYADVQAKYKAPSVDAFVQALKQVNSGESGSGGSETGASKDIVLELNGRELGRAIDVHLEDKHNLRTN